MHGFRKKNKRCTMIKKRKDEDRLNGRQKGERVRDASIGVGPNKQSGAYAERTLC
jgi:hypothetical protein